MLSGSGIEMPAMRQAGEKQNKGQRFVPEDIAAECQVLRRCFIRKRQIVKDAITDSILLQKSKAVEETDDYDKIDIVSAEGRSDAEGRRNGHVSDSEVINMETDGNCRMRQYRTVLAASGGKRTVI